MKRFWIAALSALAMLMGPAKAADVNNGYQLVYGPWKANMEKLQEEGLGGKIIEFSKFTLGIEVINAMASGSVDISLNGSSPTAAGYNRGVDHQVIYIYDNINDAEALVVNDKITGPQDLKGKTIAVPFGSTTHFHMMFALEQLGISPEEANVIDMSPPAARFLATDIVFLGIVVIGLIAFFLDVPMRCVERLLVPWKGKA